MANIIAGMESMWDAFLYFIRFGVIPPVFYELLPLFMALLALYKGVKLLRTLRPGMVCRASLGCNRCELLYAVGLSACGLSSMHILLTLRKWFIAAGCTPGHGYAALLHCLYDSAGLFFLFWVSHRCLDCLQAHSAFDQFPICKGRRS